MSCPALCRASTSCLSSCNKDVDGSGTRACPSSALLTAASRINPTCGDKPRHDGVAKGGRAICRLLDEFVAVELLDRRRLLDEAFGQIEVLQLGEPLGVDLAQLLLSRVDQVRVHGERESHCPFLSLPVRHEAYEIVRLLVRIIHDVLHPA